LRVCQVLVEELMEPAAVGQAGERIVQREMADLGLGFDLVGDVRGRAAMADRCFAVLAADGAGGDGADAAPPGAVVVVAQKRVALAFARPGLGLQPSVQRESLGLQQVGQGLAQPSRRARVTSVKRSER